MESKYSYSNNTQSLILTNDITSIEEIACKFNMFLSIIGVIGNILSIMIFSKSKFRARKFNWYLLALSTCEVLFTSLILVDYIFTKIYSKSIFLHDLNNFSSIAFDFTMHTTDSYTSLLAVILSFDRLYAIKNPMKIKYYITCVHAKLLILLSFASLVSVKILGFIICEFKIKNYFHIVYCTFLSPLIFNILPIVFICILNSFLVIRLINYYREQPKINFYSLMTKLTNTSISNKSCRMSNIQRSHYFIILVSSFWFILTSISYYFLQTYFDLVHINLKLNITTIEIVHIVSSILFNSNHCINFFIYLSFYKDFRACFLNFFLKLICYF